MKTENFSLASAGDTWIRQGLVRVLRYDSGDAGGPTPTIRVTSLSGSDIDLEMVPGRIVTLPRPMGGLVIRSLAGAGINGKFTWGEGLVEDNTFSGSFDLTLASINALINAKYNTRPESANGSLVDTSTMGAGGVVTMFAPGVNTNGAILFGAYSVDNTGLPQAFIEHTAAPSALSQGRLVALSSGFNSTANMQNISLQAPQLIPAGMGLYFFSVGSGGANWARGARWRLL